MGKLTHVPQQVREETSTVLNTRLRVRLSLSRFSLAGPVARACRSTRDAVANHNKVRHTKTRSLPRVLARRGRGSRCSPSVHW